MSTHNAKEKFVTPIVHDELILVVQRKYIFQEVESWLGLKKINFDDFLQVIQSKKEFLPRSLMGQDQSYKQIIPYLIFSYDDKYFLMQRTSQSTEKRLSNKYSLGIGGHIRQEDMQTNSLFDWATREFHEEVHYQHSFTIEPLGILNDDTNDVGKVHLGFVFLLKGTSADISVKSELKSGVLLSLDQMSDFYSLMEPWTQMVYNFLSKK